MKLPRLGDAHRQTLTNIRPGLLRPRQLGVVPHKISVKIVLDRRAFRFNVTRVRPYTQLAECREEWASIARARFIERRHRRKRPHKNMHRHARHGYYTLSFRPGVEIWPRSIENLPSNRELEAANAEPRCVQFNPLMN